MTKYNPPGYFLGRLPAIALTFIFMGAVINASADMAPPAPAAGSDLGPSSGSTMVRMVSEEVLLDITPLGQTSVAYVTARFFMQNMGETTEQMTARFPMNSSEWLLESEVEEGIEACQYTVAPPITDFSVRVDGVSVDSEVTYETFYDHINSGPETGDVYVTLPCWAHFDVTFPPGVTVEVEIKYTQAEYDRSGGGVIEFAYVIGTGEGWFSTIGSADIAARLPYPITELNLAGCLPENCTISDYEIAYHYEDFEPQGNLYFRIIKPEIWMRILKENKNIAENQNDGEAWGRLARAYKDAVDGSKGQISWDRPMFELSIEAYEKAVELLPEDADWHYGFADLLCRAAEFGRNSEEGWNACLWEVKTTLELEPNHEQGLALLEHLDWLQDLQYLDLNRPLVDISGPDPDYLYLTPGPSQTPTRPALMSTNIPADTPTSSPVPATEVAKIDPTQTRSLQAPQASTPTAVVVPVPDDPGSSLLILVLISLGVISVAILAAAFLRRR